MQPEPERPSHTVPPDRGPIEAQPKWRQDFPIDRDQDRHVARRDFTKFLCLTSLAFVVGQFWIALRHLWGRPPAEDPTGRIAALDQVPVGGAVTFHYPASTDPCVLIRPEGDTLLAYASQCTHLQCPVLPEVEAGRLRCPCHAGYFDLATGRPTAGPPRRSLPRISLEVREGVVYATGVEEETV